MDSGSDEEKYSTSEDMEDEPRPPSRRFPMSRLPSPDFSASSSEDEDDVGNVAGQQPQPCLWTLPPQPRRHVVHTLTEQMTDCGKYETYLKLKGRTFQNFTTLPNIWQ